MPNKSSDKSSMKASEATKMEAAKELGLDDELQEGGWENLSQKELGQVGAQTKKLLHDGK